MACGRTDGFFEYILSPWDYAAGAVIVKEAGARIEAILPDVLTYEKPVGICAASETLWDTLMGIVMDAKKQ